MGSLTDLLGKSPRVAILEAFAEHPELEFSVPEIVRQTGVSKRGAYLHIVKLLEEGIITKGEKSGKCQYYKVNESDRRGEYLGLLESVFTLGKLEREMKRDRGIPPEDPLVGSLRPEHPEYDFIFWPDPTNVGRIDYHDFWQIEPTLKVNPRLRYVERVVSQGTTANEVSAHEATAYGDLLVETKPKKIQMLTQ